MGVYGWRAIMPITRANWSGNRVNRKIDGLMRLAILSDIHGNQLALQAVLADLQQTGAVELAGRYHWQITMHTGSRIQ